ncbi:MAG: TadE/TadG family type IV pilus assembly protein [Pseudomonadota bacterium]|nr:TadE/TadG family type IV pilus assembly protein [Pseudomonadota bacterium]
MTKRRPSLLCDERGVTIIEFALIAPVLLLMLMGLLDLAFNMYTTEMLQGAIQNAARNSSIEGASGKDAQLDAIVTTAVRAVAPSATLAFDRRAYSSFTEAGRPEDYTDVDKDGTCNHGEPFEDANGNGAWDLDRGKAGFGGARDAVLYTVTVNYHRPFPVAAFIPGQTNDFTMNAATVLRNQPYGQQSVNPAPVTGNCP